jgi:hypothetical protein
MRKRLMVLVMGSLMLVMSAAPSLANHGDTHRPRPVPPASPRGLADNEHEQRPDHACTPRTGPVRDGTGCT